MVLKLLRPKVLLGFVLEVKFSWERPLAPMPKGWEWMAQYVNVKGFVSVASPEGMIQYAHIPSTPLSLPGRIMSGSRMRRERKVLRQTVPNKAPVAWRKLAFTTSALLGCGTARRWKYHCDTTAAVVAR